VLFFLVFAVLNAAGILNWQQTFWIFGLSKAGAIDKFRLFQFVTAPLVHSSLLHLCFNMLTLWMLGPGVEAVLGRNRYLLFSTGCALTGEIALLLLTDGPRMIVMGYSSVIYGLLVAQAVCFPNNTLYMFGLFPLKMKYAVLMLAGIELYLSLASGAGQVLHVGHLFGAAAALVMLKAFRAGDRLRASRWPETRLQCITMKPVRRAALGDVPWKL
jgi:membrane associated rhomboid family serine protease